MQQPVNWPGWEFVRKLGSGSYGSVYEIRQQVGPLERRAALKVIPVPRDENELEDLNDFESINLDTKDLWGFADLLFDGVIVDVTMQNRIKTAGDAVDRAIQKVQDILEKI